MKERIQKILSARGVASRRKAEEMILAGRVCCNGSTCALGDTADPEVDEITVDGQPLPKEEKRLYILLHKPRGFVSTLSDEKGRRNVTELVSDCGARVYPVGRLDMDSEGLLLLSNDGEFANRLMHPKHEVEKCYRVYVRHFTEPGLQALSQPVTLDGYTIRKPKVRLIKQIGDTAELLVTIHEGRNRQVRRMCELAGMYVTRLIRIREGSLELGDLPKGKWRHLTAEEITALQK